MVISELSVTQRVWLVLWHHEAIQDTNKQKEEERGGATFEEYVKLQFLSSWPSDDPPQSAAISWLYQQFLDTGTVHVDIKEDDIQDLNNRLLGEFKISLNTDDADACLTEIKSEIFDHEEYGSSQEHSPVNTSIQKLPTNTPLKDDVTEFQEDGDNTPDLQKLILETGKKRYCRVNTTSEITGLEGSVSSSDESCLDGSEIIADNSDTESDFQPPSTCISTPKAKPTNSKVTPLQPETSFKYCKYEGCKFQTKHKQSLYKHEKRHNKEYSCEVCKKKFAQRYQLKDHLELSHGEVKLICDVCCKTFRSKNGLKTHLQCHTDGAKYCCQICGNKYNTKNVFEGHMNNHIGNKPYKCDKPGCTSTFTYKSNFLRHVKSKHTLSDKTCHKCSVCGMKFSRPCLMKEHEASKHGDAVYTCVCGKKYKWRPSFVRHKKTCTYLK